MLKVIYENELTEESTTREYSDSNAWEAALAEFYRLVGLASIQIAELKEESPEAFTDGVAFEYSDSITGAPPIGPGETREIRWSAHEDSSFSYTFVEVILEEV